MKALGIVSVAVELTVESSVVYTGFSTLRISSLVVSKLDVFIRTVLSWLMTSLQLFI